VSHPDWFRRLVPGRGASRPRKSVLITAVSAALVVIAGVAVLMVMPGKTALRTTSVAASSQDQQTGNGARPAHSTQPAAALQITSVTPGSNSRNVDGTSPIQVSFSAPLAQSTPLPRLSPSVAGSWKVDGTSATFTPSTGVPESTTVTITVPGGSSGMRSAAGAKAGAGGYLASGFTRNFSTGPYSTLRLEQLLAQLGYLPLTWAPAGTAIQPADTAGQLAAAYSPPSGSFTWQSGYPSVLHSLWSEGSGNLVLSGAVRAFQSEQGLTMDGVAGPQVWSDVLKAVAGGHSNGNGYTYALASQSIPETLTVWHDGREVLRSAANTGIPAAPTANGTFPVYLRLPFQIMKGTNPDGSKYADPVSWISYFNGGDAVHYFVRGSYGWPQSLGCVELPETAAKSAYGYLTYGSLVTVTG
jgi:peptidoglycan hydrolase-like protein with peptidoglycan-binding domain